MIKLKKILNIFLILIIGFFISSLFSLKVSIKSLDAQTSRYTVFRTENEGFKFYKISGQNRFFAPLFAQTPTATSDKNQVATKEYVDNKTTIRYYEGEFCYLPFEEMVIGGTTADHSYNFYGKYSFIGGEPFIKPDGERYVNFNYDYNYHSGEFLYSSPGYDTIKKYPVGIENARGVSCLKIPSNPIKAYVLSPLTYNLEAGKNGTVSEGGCHFTEESGERERGYERNFFKRPCSWSLVRRDTGGLKIEGKMTERDGGFFNLPIELRRSVRNVTIDLYSNDGGFCLARFKNPQGFELELAITQNTEVPTNIANIDRNFNFDNLHLYGSGANYSQVGPFSFIVTNVTFNGNWNYKVSRHSIKGRDFAVARVFKPSNRNITNPADFWGSVSEIEMLGKTNNSAHWGANICKIVIDFVGF